MKNKFFSTLWTFLLLGSALHAQDIVSQDFFAAVVNNCNGTADVCLDIPLESSAGYTFLADDAPYAGEITGCAWDTLLNYDYSGLFGQGSQGPYLVTDWTVNGETFSGQFQDIPALVALMNEWNPEGNWVHNPAGTSVDGGQPDGSYGFINITVLSNGMPAMLGFGYNINAQGMTLTFSTGTHNVIITETATGITDNFVVSVLCQPTTETKTITLTEGETETSCLDFSELTGGTFGTIAAGCNSGNEGIAEFSLVDAGSCVEVSALNAGTDSACFIAADAAGNTDTTYFTVNVMPLVTEPFYFENTIPANQEVYQLCLDQSELLGEIESIENICAEESGAFVSFTLDAATNCVKYAGLECDGTENACIVLCDNLGICDTTFMTITVDNTVCQPQPEYVENTIYQGQFGSYCFNTNDLPGSLISIENACEGTDNVDFILDELTFCVDYEGITVGTSNACVVVTDDLGNTDTTYFTVNVITPQVSVVTDVILPDEMMTYCPETGELPGNTYTISNICEESSGENVIFNIDDVSLCLDATALSIGTDTACIVICDENLICDTTFYYITVEEDNNPVSNIPPVAVDDSFSTSENSLLSANVLGNDTIPPGSQIVVYVLPEAGGGAATEGRAEANSNGTIDYTPVDGFCGEDMFTYVLCNQYGCDTARVVLNVECINIENAEITVKNGFSPNGDGVNDFFKVEGIENYPNNTLTIINRWGNIVYETLSYRGNWDAEWGDKILPDGTYFYFLEVEDIGMYRGYVEIKR